MTDANLAGWQQFPALAVLQPRSERNVTELPLLSLSADLGIRKRATEGGRTASEDLSDYRVVRKDDLVINKLIARDGAIAVSSVDGLVSPAYWVFAVNRSLAVPKFLHYLLRSQPYLAEIARRSKFMPPAQFDLPRDQLRRLPLVLPDSDRQQAIADFLDAETARIDELIIKRTRMLILLKERWRASIDQLFAGSECSPLPLKRLLLRGPAYGVLVPRFVDSNGVPFIRGNDLGSLGDRLAGLVQIDPSQSQEYSRTVVQPGDLLLSVVGSVDKVAVVPSGGAGCNIARAVARLRPRQGIDSVVLQTAMAGSSYLRQAYEATSADTAQPTLGMGDLANFRLAWPSLACGQVRLRTEIDRLSAFRRIVNSELTRQIHLLRERRQALITTAVTGEIDVARGAA